MGKEGVEDERWQCHLGHLIAEPCKCQEGRKSQDSTAQRLSSHGNICRHIFNTRQRRSSAANKPCARSIMKRNTPKWMWMDGLKDCPTED